VIKFNGHFETGKIISVLVKTPQAAWISQENIDCQWEKLHYPGRPDYHKALAEYDCFIFTGKGWPGVPSSDWAPCLARIRKTHLHRPVYLLQDREIQGKQFFSHILKFRQSHGEAVLS
jgi:hypothetical protein